MGMLFGNEENIDCIVDVDLKGANDEALCLAHKHSKLFIVAGVHVSDDGYVLGVKGNSSTYYDMPEGEELAVMQQEGLLPETMPSYEISTWDYAWGYSLWIFIALMLLYYVGSWLLPTPKPRPDSLGDGADGLA